MGTTTLNLMRLKCMSGYSIMSPETEENVLPNL